jgi:hypothetical protein
MEKLQCEEPEGAIAKVLLTLPVRAIRHFQKIRREIAGSGLATVDRGICGTYPIR